MAFALRQTAHSHPAIGLELRVQLPDRASGGAIAVIRDRQRSQVRAAAFVGATGE
jgi:hypothetical protein